MPQKKKHPSTRARANKAATAATLSTREATDYSDWTIAEIRAELTVRNETRETPLSKRGSRDKLAALLLADDAEAPQLPDRPAGWHPMTQMMWADIWASPMAEEWDESDIHNVYLAAMIYDDSWRAETARERKEAAGEYRLQRVDLGLSPYSRRRLEWTIETAEDAKDKGTRRRQRPAVPAPSGGKRPDPRAGLHAVS